MPPRRVVFLPGAVTPVQLSYAPLLEELGGEIDPILKELEVYASDPARDDYSIALEVEALTGLLDREGIERAHLVAFSGGGAVSLSFAAHHPERLASLAMFEPANVPGSWDPYERAFDQKFRSALADVAPDQAVATFTRLQLRPGVEPPAPRAGPEPDWMGVRPAGINAMMRAFVRDTTDREALRSCRVPVYLAYGMLTGEYMVHRVQILASLLPDLWIEAFDDVHHFAPPQRTRPAHYAQSLRSLWNRADDMPAHHSLGDSGYAA